MVDLALDNIMSILKFILGLKI